MQAPFACLCPRRLPVLCLLDLPDGSPPVFARFGFAARRGVCRLACSGCVPRPARSVSPCGAGGVACPRAPRRVRRCGRVAGLARLRRLLVCRRARSPVRCRCASARASPRLPLCPSAAARHDALSPSVKLRCALSAACAGAACAPRAPAARRPVRRSGLGPLGLASSCALRRDALEARCLSASSPASLAAAPPGFSSAASRRSASASFTRRSSSPLRHRLAHALCRLALPGLFRPAHAQPTSPPPGTDAAPAQSDSRQMPLAEVAMVRKSGRFSRTPYVTSRSPATALDKAAAVAISSTHQHAR